MIIPIGQVLADFGPPTSFEPSRPFSRLSPAKPAPAFGADQGGFGDLGGFGDGSGFGQPEGGFGEAGSLEFGGDMDFGATPDLAATPAFGAELEFSEPEGFGADEFGTGSSPSLELEAGPSPQDMAAVEQRVADARQDGFAEGEAAGRAALEADMEALQSDAENRLVEARREWAEQQGDIMAEQMRHALEELEKRFADTMAEMVAPLLNKGIRAAMLEDLRQTIAGLMAGDAGRLIRVSGPGDLVERLQSRFEGSEQLEFAHDDMPEITVLAGDTTVHTQLQAWAERLDTVFEEG